MPSVPSFKASSKNAPPVSSPREEDRRAYRKCVGAVALLLLGFAWPLIQLARFALEHDMYSHILLVPLVSLYFFWQQRRTLPPTSAPSLGLVALPFVIGVALLGAFVLAIATGHALLAVNQLALTVGAFVALIAAAVLWFLGPIAARALAFPLGFLVFMIPLPDSFLHGIETFLQHGSAAVASVLFRVVGTTMFQDDLIFHLPRISLEVAPECSGIRSTLVLLITSVIAAHLFLRTTSRRLVLVAIVLPLALLRNGFRVFTLGQLCVHIGPHMIDSPIHHRGGPIFFALSMIPFLFVLRYLVRAERRNARLTSNTATA